MLLEQQGDHVKEDLKKTFHFLDHDLLDHQWVLLDLGILISFPITLL